MEVFNKRPFILKIFGLEIPIYSEDTINNIQYVLNYMDPDNPFVYFTIDEDNEITIFDNVPYAGKRGWTYTEGEYNPIGRDHITLTTEDWRTQVYECSSEELINSLLEYEATIRCDYARVPEDKR